ncbi:MAG: hypothetical protein V8T86_04490 [Victivallis sp.]
MAEAQKKLEKDGLLIREFSAADIDADPARIGFPGFSDEGKERYERGAHRGRGEERSRDR